MHVSSNNNINTVREPNIYYIIYYYYFCIPYEKTEAQKGQVTCPRQSSIQPKHTG